MNRCTQDTQHCLLTIFQPPSSIHRIWTNLKLHSEKHWGGGRPPLAPPWRRHWSERMQMQIFVFRTVFWLRTAYTRESYWNMFLKQTFPMTVEKVCETMFAKCLKKFPWLKHYSIWWKNLYVTVITSKTLFVLKLFSDQICHILWKHDSYMPANH